MLARIWNNRNLSIAGENTKQDSHFGTVRQFLTKINIVLGNSLVVQWLGLCTVTAEGPGSITGWGTKIPQAAGPKKKKK